MKKADQKTGHRTSFAFTPADSWPLWRQRQRRDRYRCGVQRVHQSRRRQALAIFASRARRTDPGPEDTSAKGITSIHRAGIVVIADDGHQYAIAVQIKLRFPAWIIAFAELLLRNTAVKEVAEVFRRRVAVIAIHFFKCAAARSADVIGAGIAVIAIVGNIPAAERTVAEILGTRITVVAIRLLIHATRLWIAEVLRAVVTVVASKNSENAARLRNAPVGRAWIAVVAHARADDAADIRNTFHIGTRIVIVEVGIKRDDLLHDRL